MCEGTLVAESDRLTVVVVAAQAHFLADPNNHNNKDLNGKEVLEDKYLIWRIEEPMKTEKLLSRPHKGLSFDGVLKEVTVESKEAANLPRLKVFPTA